MGWIWFIVGLTAFGFGMYKLGLADLHDDEKIGVLWIIFFGAILWPFVLIAAVIIGPFVGLFWLGKRKREQREQDKKSDK